MQVDLPEIEILLFQMSLLKRQTLSFIKVNFYGSKLTEKMIGHKLGEFSNKNVGARIMILREIKKRKTKINKNNGSYSNANAIDQDIKKMESSWIAKYTCIKHIHKKIL